MAAQSFIIFPGNQGWQIAAWTPAGFTWREVPGEAGSQGAEVASQIARKVAGALGEMGYHGQPAAMALPAAWCLASAIRIDDLPRDDRKAMLYRLEENLPLAAESVIADFIVPPQRSHTVPALGVAVRSTQLAPLVEALEAAGVAVQSIIPAALAAAQLHASHREHLPTLLLARDNDASVPRINLIALQGGRPIHWALLPADRGALKLHLELLAAQHGQFQRIETMNVDPKIIDFLEISPQNLLAHEASLPSAAVEFAAVALAGKQVSWVDFRRGLGGKLDPLRLQRKWLNACVAAAVALVLSLTIALLIRSYGYDRLENNNQQQMRSAFQQHFPGWAMPASVKAIIEAEHRKTQAALNISPQGERQGSALSTLQEVLLHLPQGGNYLVNRMTFEANSFQIAGKLQSYEQADALASAARKTGMQVPPPQTRREKDDLWSFLIDGARPLKSNPSAESAGMNP